MDLEIFLSTSRMAIVVDLGLEVDKWWIQKFSLNALEWPSGGSRVPPKSRKDKVMDLEIVISAQEWTSDRSRNCRLYSSGGSRVTPKFQN